MKKPKAKPTRAANPTTVTIKSLFWSFFISKMIMVIKGSGFLIWANNFLIVRLLNFSYPPFSNFSTLTKRLSINLRILEWVSINSISFFIIYWVSSLMVFSLLVLVVFYVNVSLLFEMFGNDAIHFVEERYPWLGFKNGLKFFKSPVEICGNVSHIDLFRHYHSRKRICR